MDARRSIRRFSLTPLALAFLLAGCGGTEQAPAQRPQAKAIEIGPMQPAPGPGTAGVARVPLDTKDIEWVTGFRAEPGVPSAPPSGWHADLRLANGTRLLAAATGMPPIVFPEGFGVSLGQILRETPEGWRRAEIVGSVGAGLTADDRLRVTIGTTPARTQQPEDEPLAMKRLYVLSLPLLAENVADEPEPLPDFRLVTDPRAYWPVPAGGTQVRTGRFSYLVPTDSTVHYVAVWHEGPARSVKITDRADGKVLWQADAAGGTIASYSSANGFPLYREHEYEVEVTFLNPAGAPVSAAAALFVYYRPPGDEAFGYPYPPPGEVAAP